MLLMSDVRSQFEVKVPVKKRERCPVGQALPSALEVVRYSRDLSDELNRLAADLNSLLSEKENIVRGERNHFEIRERPHRIDQYQGFLLSRDLFDEFREANRARIQRSHKKFTVQSNLVLDTIEELPQYLSVMDRHAKFLPHIFTAMFWRASLVQEQKLLYAMYYVELWKVWRQEAVPAIDTLNLKYHIDMRGEWGEEQPEARPTVPFEGPRALEGVAPDVEMRLRVELPAYNDFVNNNGFVEDPVKEHMMFKRRLYWTNEDRELFIQLFWKHPHRFAKIAESFPNKTAKDMIEFYYLIKNSQEMAATKAMKNRRGVTKEKKVITEGKVGRK